MLKELPNLLPSTSMTGTNTQIRCFGHIPNLAVKAILSIFDSPTNKTDNGNDEVLKNLEDAFEESNDELDSASGDEDIDMAEVGEDEEAEYDENDDTSSRAAADAAEIEELGQNLEEVKALSTDDKKAGYITITKLRKLGKMFRNNDILQNELVQCCKTDNIEPKKMIRAVDTRWNTMLDVIDRALYLRLPLDRLLSMGKYTRKGKGKKMLVHLKLSSDEWDLLVEIRPILKWFKIATQHFSKSNRPLLAEVIPYIDSITKKLEDVIGDYSKSPIVRAAAAKGYAIMNKYYGKTDYSIMYRMCMSTFFHLL
ncbi:hypothetical protein K435DRAFT_702637 [Dendrothele bispora CBS 962.96]|uniref:hAT-like transposase RNase-H fold domain-containing protein n=1 Tax=Dendrothele bispora (strain CBS 962.96) TaxID=1314807 RepID=A0A4S8KNV5_DENBC|nr:hypothetical protein K435DRAFT_702637 [Dendrothele bispora CBS 962.96]